MASSAEQQLIPKDKESKSICIIKRIHFFGRSVKIVMQNENGPCPLLAIANVLSLRNELKLPAGIREITQSELITCIVDLLLERSKHFDAAYAADYQQNISEIFPVLQKLTTGVDVNVKFHNLHAFEPTPEVAVFDLLGIPLVHGWLVDPQDGATAAVFGNKSYNELVEMLFLVLGDEKMEALSTGALRNLSISSHHMHSSFSAIGSPAAAAARTPSHGATAPGSSSASFAARSGDAAATQSAALEKALQGLSMSQQQQHQQRDSSAGGAGGSDGSTGAQQPQQQQLAGLCPSIQQEVASAAGAASLAAASPQQQQPGSSPVPQATAAAAAPPLAAADADAGADVDSDAAIELLVEDMVQEVCSQSMPGAIPLGDSPTHNLLLTRRLAYEGTGPSRLNASSSSTGGGAAAASATTPAATAGSSSGQETAGHPAPAASPAAAAPPPAEGSGAAGGAAAAAAQGSPVGASTKAASAADAAVVRSFMEQHCSQLTPYGLHAMADSLKEHQLAVFFRNNHFNALFKYEGAVYLLVTDQGYEYEPDIVWERLDSVQGDTSFCTGDFAPFVPHRAPEGDLGASYSQVVAGGSAAAGAAGNLAALTDLDAAIAASLAAEDQHHHQQQQRQQQQGSQHSHGLAAAGDEDADFALALQLQLQEEEAMARAQIQQQQQQQGQGPGQGPQQQQRQGGSRVAAVQQQEQQAQAQPLESLRQMGQRLATGIQQQYVAATDALVGQQAAMQQQQPGRRRSSHAAGGRRGSAAPEEKCSIM